MMLKYKISLIRAGFSVQIPLKLTQKLHAPLRFLYLVQKKAPVCLIQVLFQVNIIPI